MILIQPKVDANLSQQKVYERGLPINLLKFFKHKICYFLVLILILLRGDFYNTMIIILPTLKASK
jgi:hypothetical protein